MLTGAFSDLDIRKLRTNNTSLERALANRLVAAATGNYGYGKIFRQ